MKFLLMEINKQAFAVRLNEVERLLPVTGKVLEAVNHESGSHHVVVEGKTREIICIRRAIFQTCTVPLRGTRLLVPMRDSKRLYLCEIVSGLIDCPNTEEEFLVVDGRPVRVVSFKDFLNDGNGTLHG